MLTSQLKTVFLWLRIIAVLLISGTDGEDVFNYPPKGFDERQSPRLDHNGWKPLGFGDPLKNDPTFDYSPPALERVRYWAENNKSKDEIGRKDKTDILLLGVSPKRESMRKEQKHVSIRRSYYGGQLPTRLMPPPMHTIHPHKQNFTTEMYQYPTRYPSSSKTYYTTMPSSAYRNKWPYDSKHDESVNYLSLTRPSVKYVRPSPNSFVDMPLPRKPWVHELLQKELIKPKPSPPKLLPTTSMKTIAETHPPVAYITTTYIPPTTMLPPPSTTTYRPMYPSYRPTTSKYVFPTVASVEVTAESPLKEPHGHLEVSSYQIIEGHSKVKTYGQNDNETSTHEPKIVPITPRQESVVHHVTSHDESKFSFQVKHLHSKQSTTPRTTTTTATRAYPYSTLPVQGPAQQESSMQGLLSLLDSSLGNIFINEPTGDDMGTLFSGPSLDNEPTIFVTTTSTSVPPTALELGSPRSARQIFDYDQLPESRIKELAMPEFDDDSVMEPINWDRSSGSDIIAEGENR